MSVTDRLIHLEGIRKVFHTDEVETHGLSDVHLEIARGECVAISGPSGGGKTTLLSILGLLDSPTSGTYTLDGQPVAGLSPAERALVRNRQIGFVFQAFNLIGDLSVYENVELPLTYRGLPTSRNVFVPFFTTKRGGTGIGLALSRQLAEAHGGILTLDDRDDRTGCRAVLTLPGVMTSAAGRGPQAHDS